MTAGVRRFPELPLLRLFAGVALLAWALNGHALIPFTGVATISAGSTGQHTCAVVGSGAKCWGDNTGGQLGDGTTNPSYTPIAVNGMTSGVTSVVAGYLHSCAIVTGGAVKCWGNNSTGQLGDGTLVQRLTATAVMNISSGATALALGGGHTCALVAGGVKCWGQNTNGQLGDNSTTQRLAPVSVSGLSSGVIAIAAGLLHTCAVLNTGAVRCWGLNTNGQIGDNSQTQRLIPVAVSGLTTGGTAVSAGNSHTCALIGGGVKCWGLNTNGQLGDNSQSMRLTPVDVTGLTSGVTAIALGSGSSCALTETTGAQCWGANLHGELGDTTLVIRRLVPVDVTGLATGVTAITAGARHGCALLAAGAVVCWGDNSAGSLGDNATTQRLSPTLVSGQPTLKAMSGGGLHTCAIVGAGGVKCWGANDSGQLGDNSNTQRLAPVDVVGLAGGVAAVVTGASHSCALTTAGGVRCWGDNSAGQLGDNSQTQRITPVSVSGLASGVKAIAAGDTHTCALTNAGGVKCWGQNSTGQVGDGTFNNLRLVPFDVLGLTSGVAAIKAGGLHTCAITSGSGVKCWGWNGFGQIGDGSITQRNAPVDVSGLTSGVSNIALGQYHSCALVVGGIKCWGWNDYGQVGDNSSGTSRLTPVNVLGLASGVAGIAAGNGHSCAVMAAGGVKCWGDNTYGQVGDATSANTRLAPVDVAGVTGASAVAVGGLHSCVRVGGGLACWGLNSNGQIGDGSVNMRPTASDVAGLIALASASGGGTHSCAVSAGGGILCWGGNVSGQLGDGTLVSEVAPAPTTGIASGATAVAAGNNHSCALVAGGGKCWGDNTYGQLGDNTKLQRLTPVDVGGLSGAVAIMASMGGDHTCAITGGGAAMCWGNNVAGQLGDGSSTMRLTPVPVFGLGSGTTAIAGGLNHSCTVTNGGAKCWGVNNFGQLGDGTQTQRLTPTDVSGLTSGVTAIATGSNHSCAVAAGGLKCWGINTTGQLGDGTFTQRLVPVAVTGLGSGVTAVTAGLTHTCALTTAGGVKCWGLNSSGQVGDGTTTQRFTPVDVSGLASGVTAIAAGQNHTCAVITNVGVKCWGENNEGELGDGTMGTRPFPGSVLTIGPATQLTITGVNGGSNVAVGAGFSVIVQSLDTGGTPAPVIAATGVSLGLVGPGAIGGVTTCTILAGASTCAASGTTIDTAQIGALISANRTSGDALTGGLSAPFNVIATAPGAPTGVTAVQSQGGILVTFNPPVNTGGAPIISYTVTCNPGVVTVVGAASPVLVTGLTNNTPYTCNVRATNTVGSGGVSSPSGSVFYTVAQRTFVASTGIDSSSLCAPTAPCRTLAAALIRTVAGGEVIVLDSAPYDVITITQPVSILAAAGIFAGISALPGQSAITVSAGPAASVFLRGLVITSEGGNNGILFTSGGALYLENVIVRGYAQVGQVNVNFQPTGAAKLFVKDSRIQSGATGLRIANAGADIGVTIDNVRFEGNGTGIKAIANGQLTVRNSVVAEGSQDGISLAGANALPLTAAFDKLLVSGNAAAGITSGGALPVYTTVSRSTVRGNGGTGIFVSNSATSSVTRVAQSTIARNAIGLGTGAGGSILSRGNNTLEANNADGSFTGSYSGK
ncbi:MAG: right-handed parallel beta-helix repeat-containing protein [Casimicrobiaceae bacterium]